MNFIDRLLGRNNKATQIANARMDLPLPQTMRGTGFYSGIGMQDLFANLSRRLPNSTKDWVSICGDLMLNSIVAISLDYFIRAFIDSNNNGKWDTGNLVKHIQPENVYYYPKKLNVKANWEFEETWDLYGTPLLE